jgi:predicted enzyme related to lactoylglutathione lyase
MHVECIDPILRVEDMSASVAFYVGVLGFENAPWGTNEFTRVERDFRGIYLCRGGQGHAGTWVWIGVDDVRALHRALVARGARIRSEPRNEPWGLEMQVEDPDGHVLRFGSDREDDAEPS